MFYKKTYIVLATFLIVGLGKYCQADDASSVLSQLQANDKLMAAGTIDYTVMRHRAETKQLAADRLAVTQRQLDRENVPKEVAEAKLKQAKVDAASMSAMQNSGFDEQIAYTSDRKFMRTSVPLKVPGNVQPIKAKETYDGQNDIVSGVPDNATIGVGKPMDLDTSHRAYAMYPGPCFILGRGLSLLQNPKVTTVGSDVKISGDLGDGTSIEASLDPLHGYVARHINRLYQGRTVGHIELGAPVQSESGTVWVASSADYSAYGEGGHVVATADYRIKSASFKSPPDSDFDFLLTPGMTIVDNRLGQQVIVKQTSSQSITANDLLPMTRKVLQQQTHLAAREAAYQDARRSKQRRTFGFILAAVLLLFAAIVAWARRTRSSKPAP